MKKPLTVRIGLSTCGIAAGGNKTFARFGEQLTARNLAVDLKKTGCIGLCYHEPLVDILTEDGHVYTYGAVTEDKVPTLIDEHISGGRIVHDLLINDDKSKVTARQVKIALRNCGLIDPDSIADYINEGGYTALKTVLSSMTPDQVSEEITASGLRGRGGAGFPTGLKWRLTRQSPGSPKYVVCNADEGDPGAFMDRSIVEGDPHSIVEGMLIAAYAIGATEGHIYIRAEYPLAIAKMQKALDDADEHGYLGEKILSSSFSFTLKIKKGAGAFVCGEETALIASLEGKRGMPLLKPPFPAQKGLWQKPTTINNVETFANVPWIIREGAKRFAAFGTAKSKGTKVFALAGKINNGGLVEVPIGMPLREIIFDIGGGIQGGKRFKGVQLGGPSGGCLPEEELDTIVDYDELVQKGAMMGSGGMIVMDETTCMVDIARFFLNFTKDESCGKCVHCRLGTKRMLEILELITAGKAAAEDLALLEELASNVKEGSLCGLGQTAPNPVLTTLKYFRHEYEEHITQKKCRAHVCKALLQYIINEKCVGCGLCVKRCPVDAISGERRKLHAIDGDKCIKCGRCVEACKFDAILVE